MNPPYFNREMNILQNRISPSMYKIKNTGLVNYYSRYLFQKAISVLEWKNIPDFWAKDYMLYVLYSQGFCAIANIADFGVIPQYCTLSGYDVFYRPTQAILTNPAYNTITCKIGDECELLRLTPDYCGIIDLVQYYAEMLAVASESASVNLINCKTTPIFKAQSKSEAETLKKMYDIIASGEPCVTIDSRVSKIADNGTGFDFFTPPTAGMFITDKILESMRNIENMFDTIIGIPNSNTQKKERMITDEVNANNEETFAIVNVWLDCLNRSLDKINNMFGLSISVNLKGGAENAIIDNDNQGNLQL